MDWSRKHYTEDKVVYIRIGHEVKTARKWLFDFDIPYARMSSKLDGCQDEFQVKRLFCSLIPEEFPVNPNDVQVLNNDEIAAQGIENYTKQVRKTFSEATMVYYDIVVRRRPSSASCFYETLRKVTSEKIRKISENEQVEILRSYRMGVSVKCRM